MEAEDRFFCFICTNELDIKREPGDSATGAASDDGDGSAIRDQNTFLLPRNVEFIYEVLGIQDRIDQRKLNNLVPESYKQVNYCCGCTRILITLRDLLEQLNSITKRLNEFKESVNQLFINAVPNELIDGWTKKLRNFLIRDIIKSSNPNPSSESCNSKTTLEAKPDPRINSVISSVSVLENEPESPDSDPEWFPEPIEENFLNPDPEIQEPQDPFAIRPCCVKLTKIRVSQTSPTTYIIPLETSSMKRRGRSLVIKNVTYENDQKAGNIAENVNIQRTFIGRRVTCHFPNCNVSFSATHRELLNVHIRRIHEGKDKPYACGRCSEEFSTSLQLRTHRIKLRHRKPNEYSKSRETSERTFIGRRINCHFPNCNASFSVNSRVLLNAHIRKIHEGKNKPYACGRCLAEFSTYVQLRTHRIKLRHRKPKEYSKSRETSQGTFIGRRVICHFPSCNVSFSAKHQELLNVHIRAIHEGKDKPYACGRCSQEFTTSLQLRKHRIKERHRKPYEHKSSNSKEKKTFIGRRVNCHFPNCNASFSATNLVFLNAHIRKVHEGKDTPYRCGQCLEEFSTYLQLRTHRFQLKHTKSNERSILKFKCTCGRFFVSKIVLENHLTRQGGTCKSALEMGSYIDTDKRFVCGVCSRKFERRHVLAIHLTSHTNGKIHTCELCGSSFKSKMYLDVHKRCLHSQAYVEMHHEPDKAQERIQKLTCQVCGKISVTTREAKSHELTHKTNEFLVHCPECKRGFNYASALKTHMLNHKPKGFKCDQCEKEFARIDKLRVHIQRVHQNVRNVTCEYCTKSFYDKTALKRHIEILHEKPTKENQFHCLPCGKSFCTKDYLRIHQRTQRHKAAVEHINSLK